MNRQIPIEKYLISWFREYRGGYGIDLGYPKMAAFHVNRSASGKISINSSKSLGDIAQDAFMIMLNDKDLSKFAHILNVSVFQSDHTIEEKRKYLKKHKIITPRSMVLFYATFNEWLKSSVYVFNTIIKNSNK